jgi:hypothetical protein
MRRELVFVHGRAQQGKDPGQLKQAWIDSWSIGLAKSNLSMPIEESAIHVPYYGDTLDALVDDGQAPDVIVMGTEPGAEERRFIAEVLEEAREARGISDAKVMEEAEGDVVELGPQNWPWVRAIAKALDRHLPGASGTTLATVTYDVHHYLRNPGVRDVIEAGVRKAITPDAESVVVGHSLGSVVAYNLLRRDGSKRAWTVPLFVTVGSPLAVTAIRMALQPIGRPACVQEWFNAMDPNDIVSLFPLQKPWFDVRPEIENKTDVDNQTPNQHGISGYLDDKEVARRIHDALVA